MAPPEGEFSSLFRRRRSLTFLGLVLLLGATLRFPGLSWGLRHLPNQFERVFVRSVWEMLSSHDLDQRSYLYPGLFFYLLLPVVALVHGPGSAGPAAYLAARAFVASAGVLSVALTAVLGARLACPRVGLLAALLVAVSPLEVTTCHAVRPDVVLECLVLLAFLAFRRVGRAPRADLLAGVAIGAASALKVTGVFLAPSYVLTRFLAPGPRWSRLLWAGVLSIATFFLFTPYAVLTPGRFLGGMQAQWSFHYVGESVEASKSHLSLARYYAGVVVTHLGPLGAGLALVGAALSLKKAARVWAPILLFPALGAAVYTTARVGAARFLVPAGGILALSAAFALEAVLVRSPRAGVLLVALTSAFPLTSSVLYLRALRKPTSLDQVADWIAGHLPRGARVLTSEKHLGLDRDQYRLVWAEGGPGDPPSAWNRMVASGVDIVVAPAGDPTLLGLSEIFRTEPSPVEKSGDPLALFRPAPTLPVSLAGGGASASEHSALLNRLLVDKTAPRWRTSSKCGPNDWIEVELSSPVPLERVEIAVENEIGTPLRLLGRAGAEEYQKIPAAEVDFEERGTLPAEEVLFFDPRGIKAIKILPGRDCSEAWEIRDLRLYARNLTPPVEPKAAGAAH
ncbi:MAG TPA: glycosyltransferase family 39 protein [Vicinamibacteria bacterium]|jgi:hypothetical protein|nr:glycosyltransferase family 39 protein [Vicinamibacteria bacterium]